MQHSIFELNCDDGSWDAFVADWTAQCEKYDEDFAEYATGTFSVVKDLVKVPEPKAGVFAIHDGKLHNAVCQINTTPLPGYDGPVMRVRHLALCPELDYGDHSIDVYADALMLGFAGIMALSDRHEKVAAKHVKLHLRSPADRQFFSALSSGLSELDEFSAVRLAGSWLYVSKN